VNRYEAIWPGGYAFLPKPLPIDPAIKNRPDQKSTESATPGRRQHASVETKKEGADTRILTVPECDSSAELAKFCDELLSVLDTSPKWLRLRFIGPHESPPDSAVILYDILTTQSNSVALITDAWSPVFGPSKLIWLAGNVRRMRPTTQFRFLSLHEVLRRLPSEDDFEALVGDAEPEVSPMAIDYKTVLRLMDQYLPVDEYAGKTITPEMLRELGLLGKSPLDDLLHKSLAGETITTQPDSVAGQNGDAI